MEDHKSAANFELVWESQKERFELYPPLDRGWSSSIGIEHRASTKVVWGNRLRQT